MPERRGLERLPPQNVEAEQGVLGSLIIDPEALSEVSDFLRPDHFFRLAHQAIYQAILDLKRADTPADFLTLCDLLEKRPPGEKAPPDASTLLDAVGGGSYLTELTNLVPTSGNAQYYGKIVRDKWVRRRLIRVAGQIAALAYAEVDENDQEIEADTALANAVALLRSIDALPLTSGARPMVDFKTEYLTRLEQINSQKLAGVAITGVPCGHSALDVRTGGFQKGDLIILGGRPGDGKTSLLLTWGRNIAEAGYTFLMFSLEMTGEGLAQRDFASGTGIDQSRLRIADITDDEWDMVVRDSDETPAGYYIDETPGLTIEEIENRARRFRDENGLDVIGIDFLQLVRALNDRGKSFENPREAMNHVARACKDMARRLSVTVIALSQLKREVDGRPNRKPVLSDFLESGGIEAAADIAMALWREDENNGNERGYPMTLLVLKGRNISKDPVYLFYRAPITKFETIDWRVDEPPDDLDEEDDAATRAARVRQERISQSRSNGR